MDAAQTIGQQNAAQQIHNGKRLPVYDIDNTDDQIGKADQPERFTDACKMRNAGIYVRKQVKRPELGSQRAKVYEQNAACSKAQPSAAISLSQSSSFLKSHAR